MKSIFAYPPMSYEMSSGDMNHGVTVCFVEGHKTVSLHLNNSNGMMTHLAKTDIRLFINDNGEETDVTARVFGGNSDSPVAATLQNFATAQNWLNRREWGFDCQPRKPRRLAVYK